MATIELITKEDRKYNTTLVFIHGLGGDARSTWMRAGRDDTFWPSWLADDFESLRVALLGYESAATNWRTPAMALPDRVSNILNILLASDFLLDCPIILICHSLGGLIAKSLILTLNNRQSSDERLARIPSNIRLVIFLGTPHYGSRLASFANIFPIIFRPSALAKGLVENDPSLRKLNDDYRVFARSRLQHLVLSEDKPIRFLGFVVAHNSADPGVMDATSIPVDATHVDICKPINREGEVYRLVKRKFLDFFADENVYPKNDRNIYRNFEPQGIVNTESQKAVSRIRLNQHALILEDFQEQIFKVLICGPSFQNFITPGSYRVLTDLVDRLQQAGFEVHLGADQGISEGVIDGSRDTSNNEIEFVRSRCDAVVFIADSIGAFCQMGAISQKIASDRSRKLAEVDFITLVDKRFATENEFFRRGTFAVLSSLGSADYVDMACFNSENLVERLKAKRMLGRVKKPMRKKGR